MRFRGIFFGVVVLAGAAFAPGVTTAGAMPSNDVSSNAAKIFVPDSDLMGVRRKAERIGGGGAIDPDTLSVNASPPSVDDVGDPPLVRPPAVANLQPSSTCAAPSTVLANPTAPEVTAVRTVWYEITQDTAGSAFIQPTLVTIDTAGSSFAAALEVFSGNVPAAFNPDAPVLPTNVVACDRMTSNSIPAQVSFLATPGTRYFLMAGVAAGPVATSPTLRLSMRVLDIETPSVTVKLDEIPDVNSVFEYTVGTGDPTAVGSWLEVTQQKGLKGKKRLIKRLSLGSKCDAARLKSRTRAGTYCIRGTSVFVHWAPVGSGAEFGRLLIKYRDRAGNVGTNSLQTQLRDRQPPVLTRASARWTQRGRLFVTATCTGGPGKIAVEYGTAKKSAGKSQVFTSTRSTTMRLRKAYPKVTRRTTFIHVVCTDRSKNADDTWLFLPR